MKIDKYNTDEKWDPIDLDGDDVKKDFIARCHVDVQDGGFLRFPLAIDKKKQATWLDQRVMAEFLESKLTNLEETVRDEERDRGYLEGVKMLEWRINCDTLISELSGWKGCVDMAVDESLGSYKEQLEQRDYLIKNLSTNQTKEKE